MPLTLFNIGILLISVFLQASDVHARHSPAAEPINLVRKSIVTIQTELARTDRKKTRTVLYTRNAAGIIVDPSGLIVANTHTIAHAPKIFAVLADGKKYQAKVVFISSSFDFSFLRISPASPLRAIEWADSDQARLTNAVSTIGHAKSHKNSLFKGRIIGLACSKNTNHPVGIIQLDLNLYKGDSGGPILDHNGRFLGLIYSKQADVEHSSFAIPSNVIKDAYINYMRKHGRQKK